MLKSIALAAIALGLVATATPAHAGDGVDLLKYAPETSQMVLVFDVADSRDSPLLQKGFQKLLDMSTDAKAKLAELGLDPMKDIDTIMFAGGGATEMDMDKVKSITIVIEGRLPKDKLATIPDATKSVYQGITIYTNHDTDAAFIGDRLFFSKKGAMKATIDIAMNKGKGKGKSVAASKKAKPLRDAIATTNTGADLWAVVMVPAKDQKNMKTEQGMVAKTVSAGMNFTADLAFELKLGTDSVDSAAKAVAMIQGQLPQVVSAFGQIGLNKAAKSIAVSQDGAFVNASIKMTEAELMSIVTMMQQFGGMGGGKSP